MASLGVSRLVIARVLNHADRGVTAAYDRHSYDSDKRAALDAWGRRLADIVGGGSDTSTSASGLAERRVEA